MTDRFAQDDFSALDQLLGGMGRTMPRPETSKPVEFLTGRLTEYLKEHERVMAVSVQSIENCKVMIEFIKNAGNDDPVVKALARMMS